MVQEELLFKGISYFGIWQPFCSVECNHLWNFGRGYYEEQLCEIILNLGQWFRNRCCLKEFLSGAQVVILFDGAEPFMQFWKKASWGTIMWSYMKFRPVVQEMSFKVISYLELLQPLYSVDWNHLCNIGRRHHEEQSCEIILNLDQWFGRKYFLKVFLISYQELWQPFCSAEGNHLCNFSRGYLEETFGEIILNLGQWFRRCHFKDFLSGALIASGSVELNNLCNFE